jgi:hypothetical protein
MIKRYENILVDLKKIKKEREVYFVFMRILSICIIVNVFLTAIVNEEFWN